MPTTQSSDLQTTLNERGANYGLFMDNATIRNALLDIVRAHPGWADFLPDQRTATEIIMQKLARALSGRAQYDDNWRDIAGYSMLIVDRINGTGTYAPQPEQLGEVRRLVRAGATTYFNASGTERCLVCHRALGDAHSPGCPVK